MLAQGAHKIQMVFQVSLPKCSADEIPNTYNLLENKQNGIYPTAFCQGNFHHAKIRQKRKERK